MKRLIILTMAAVGLATAEAQQRVKISELPEAESFSGSEEFPLNQGGATVKGTINQILDRWSTASGTDFVIEPQGAEEDIHILFVPKGDGEVKFDRFRLANGTFYNSQAANGEGFIVLDAPLAADYLRHSYRHSGTAVWNVGPTYSSRSFGFLSNSLGADVLKIHESGTVQVPQTLQVSGSSLLNVVTATNIVISGSTGLNLVTAGTARVSGTAMLNVVTGTNLTISGSTGLNVVSATTAILGITTINDSAPSAPSLTAMSGTATLANRKAGDKRWWDLTFLPHQFYNSVQQNLVLAAGGSWNEWASVVFPASGTSTVVVPLPSGYPFPYVVAISAQKSSGTNVPSVVLSMIDRGHYGNGAGSGGTLYTSTFAFSGSGSEATIFTATIAGSTDLNSTRTLRITRSGTSVAGDTLNGALNIISVRISQP